MAPVGSILGNSKGAALASSIAILDSFIKTASKEDVEKLQTLMEIILFFENGSGWVIEEAKAKLKKDIKLDQDALIDDWWILSYIYIHTISNSAVRKY